MKKNPIPIKKKAEKKKTENGKINEKEKDKFADLKKLVEIKKQKAVANELDELIREQEASKEKRERKTRNVNSMANFFAQNPERLETMSLEVVAKLSMLLNSENAKEFGKWVNVMNMNNNTSRLDYLEKLIKHLEKRIDFLEKLIFKKL